MSFELGKYAALQELVEYAEQGAGVDDVMHIIHETLNQELEKNASEEDVDYKLGIESSCHAFLKCASEIYGEYDTSNADSQEILDAVLMKLAEEEETRVQKVKGAIKRNPKKALGALALTAASLASIPGGKAAHKGIQSHGGYRQALSHIRGGEGLKGMAGRVLDQAKGSGKDFLGAYKRSSDERVDAALQILAEEGLIDI